MFSHIAMFWHDLVDLVVMPFFLLTLSFLHWRAPDVLSNRFYEKHLSSFEKKITFCVLPSYGTYLKIFGYPVHHGIMIKYYWKREGNHREVLLVLFVPVEDPWHEILCKITFERKKWGHLAKVHLCYSVGQVKLDRDDGFHNSTSDITLVEGEE